uniref:Uncharacterized protein n=1 Tax=Rhizophora mucronata TaxID=61149 RepID=A0A2P2QRL5_RHIMU
MGIFSAGLTCNLLHWTFLMLCSLKNHLFW